MVYTIFLFWHVLKNTSFGLMSVSTAFVLFCTLIFFSSKCCSKVTTISCFVGNWTTFTNVFILVSCGTLRQNSIVEFKNCVFLILCICNLFSMCAIIGSENTKAGSCTTQASYNIRSSTFAIFRWKTIVVLKLNCVNAIGSEEKS